MATWLTTMGLRSVILNAITSHSKVCYWETKFLKFGINIKVKELTALLRELKEDLKRKFVQWLEDLQHIPDRISRTDAFYIGNCRINVS